METVLRNDAHTNWKTMLERTTEHADDDEDEQIFSFAEIVHVEMVACGIVSSNSMANVYTFQEFICTYECLRCACKRRKKK